MLGKKKKTEKRKVLLLSAYRSCITDNIRKLSEKRDYIGKNCLKVTNNFNQISSVFIVCFSIFILKAGTEVTVSSALYGFVKTVRL